MSRVFTNALGLDVGMVRIGVARINFIARISEPLVVLQNDASFLQKLGDLVIEHSADLIVVGLPRNMSGQTTKQTELVVDFVKNLSGADLPELVYQDETLSSVAADARLTKKTAHMQDAVAAAIILEDFLQTNITDITGK